MISIDRTADGIAIKFGEKARVSPEKLRILVSTRAHATFTPSGVLRMDLSDEEADGVLQAAREALLELRVED